jgi:hypothetical protein
MRTRPVGVIGLALLTACTAASPSATPASPSAPAKAPAVPVKAVQLILSSAPQGSQASTPEPVPADPLLLTARKGRVELRPPGSAGSQLWVFAPLAQGSSQYRIQNEGRCLTMGEEHAVRIEACRRGDATQWWRVTPVGEALQIDLLALLGTDEVIAAYSSVGPDDHLFLTPKAATEALIPSPA